MKFKYLFLFCFVSLVFMNVHSQDITSLDRVYLNFANNEFVLYGHYDNSKSDKLKKGLDAEIQARVNAKNVYDYFTNNVCQNYAFPKEWVDIYSPQSNGFDNMKSVGSELFSNGSILIKLVAPLNLIMPNYTSLNINPYQTSDAVNYAFQIPSLAFSFLKCGTINMRLSTNKIVTVVPVILNKKGDIKIINLKLNKNVLEAETSVDDDNLTIIDFSSLFKNNVPNNFPAQILPVFFK